MSVAVVLASSGVPVTGHAAVGLDGVDTALADATLRAVVAALHEDLFMSPYAVSLVHLGAPAHDNQAVVVAVDMHVPGETAERLMGVAEVVGDIREAVVRATLDAVNRRLTSPESQDAHGDRMNG
jgi:hypothetical protein